MKLRDLVAMGRAARGIISGSRAFGAPLQASISLTNRCNLRCKHCFVYSPLLQKSAIRSARSSARRTGTGCSETQIQELQNVAADTAWIKSIIKEFIALGTRRFQFSGNGEVFMHPDVLEILSCAKDGGVPFHEFFGLAYNQWSAG